MLLKRNLITKKTTFLMQFWFVVNGEQKKHLATTYYKCEKRE